LRRALDTRGEHGHVLIRRFVPAERWFRRARKDFRDMRQLASLLRSTPSRIGRRLALIVAIAAASLPTAGA